MKSNSKNLEQFIQQNRPAFDSICPCPVHWDAVGKNLDRLTGGDALEQFVLSQRPLFDAALPSEAVWKNIDQALGATEDSIEIFIRQNREAFDAQIPDLRVWAAVEQAAPAHEAKIVRVHWSRKLHRIAAALALLVAGIGIGIWYSGGANPDGMAMSEVSDEYAELEQYYQRDISAKQAKLTNLVSYRDESLNDDLLQMDEAMSELRQELAGVPATNRERVVRAMIENYKAKAAILERVLEHLEEQQPATTNSANHEVERI